MVPSFSKRMHTTMGVVLLTREIFALYSCSFGFGGFGGSSAQRKNDFTRKESLGSGKLETGIVSWPLQVNQQAELVTRWEVKSDCSVFEREIQDSSSRHKCGPLFLGDFL